LPPNNDIIYTHNKSGVNKIPALTGNFLWVFLISMRGRPPKPPDELKSASMKIPLAEDEKTLIERAAKANDAKPVTWARAVLLNAAKRRVK